MAVSHVEELLRKVTTALEHARVEYAVVGGNAVAAWVATVDEAAVRATKDVDLLVRLADLGAMDEALRPLNLMRIEVLGVHMYVDRSNPNPKTGLHLVIANEIIRPGYAYAAPDPKAVARLGIGVRVIDLVELVKMKLLSFRLIDQVHIQDLRAVGLLDDALVKQLPADLRQRLQQIPRADTN